MIQATWVFNPSSSHWSSQPRVKSIKTAEYDYL
jgi:hypothetical protein